MNNKLQYFLNKGIELQNLSEEVLNGSQFDKKFKELESKNKEFSEEIKKEIKRLRK